MKEELSAKLLNEEKLCQKLELQLQSQSEKYQMTLQEMQKEVSAKHSLVEEHRSKELLLTKKLEE